MRQASEWNRQYTVNFIHEPRYFLIFVGNSILISLPGNTRFNCTDDRRSAEASSMSE